MISKNLKVEQTPKNNPPHTYRVIRLIGEGSFGKAYLVECNSDKVKLNRID